MFSADTLFAAIVNDTWPDSPAAISDFGLDNPDADRIYAALQDGVKSGKVTREQLRSAAGDSEKVSSLVGFAVKIGF